MTFRVDKNASKDDIRKAVEDIFSVKVAKIRTMHYKGKMKRQGGMKVGVRLGRRLTSH